jgi:formylglycine-generating enzyme
MKKIQSTHGQVILAITLIIAIGLVAPGLGGPARRCVNRRCLAAVQSSWKFCKFCGTPVPPRNTSVTGFGALAVAGTGADDEVFVDGRSYGASPKRMPKLKPGVHILQIEAPGYLPAFQKVAIKAGSTEQVTVSLIRERSESRQPEKLMTNRGDGAELTWIPGGAFKMGSDQAEVLAMWQRYRWPHFIRAPGETPAHLVEVEGFWLCRTEVTNRQYEKFVLATGHRKPKYAEDARFNGPDQPVVGVSWEDAQAYCDWAGLRLPTEAEWERAARGAATGVGTHAARSVFAWGNRLPKSPSRVANLPDESFRNGGFSTFDSFAAYDDGFTYTAPVGSFEPGEFGLYDMAGNVWEWCADWYDPNYYRKSPVRNPKGPASGDYRVRRGGAWLSIPWHVRLGSRDVVNLFEGVSDTVGFRPARSAD